MLYKQQTKEKPLRPEYRGISTIAGYKYEMDIINKLFVEKVKKEKEGENPDIFGSILFFGPNGNGKTHITKNVAKETDCNIIKINLQGFTNDNNRLKAMQKINEEAIKSERRFNNDRTRTIIFIDEVDKFIGDNSPVAKEFEDFIKTCSKKYHCSVFAATNYPEKLGIDLRNPDVFPVKMSIEPPEDDNASDMFRFYLEDYRDESIDYEELAKAIKAREDETSRKFNNGQIRRICEQVISNNEQNEEISQNELLAYIKAANPDLQAEYVNKFEEAKKKLIES